MKRKKENNRILVYPNDRVWIIKEAKKKNICITEFLFVYLFYEKISQWN